MGKFALNGCRAAICAAVVAALAFAATPAAAAPVPRDFYGVSNQHWFGGGDMWLMREAGVKTLRQHLDWRGIQSSPGRCQAAAQVGACDWRRLDLFVGGLASQGVRTFPYLLNVPRFIDPDWNTPPIRTREHRRAWRGFVTALVKRYGQRGRYWKREYSKQFPGAKRRPITHWEVWNEPNDGSYWPPKPKPREYAQLLKVTGRAIHNANPRARVVFAGLFGTPDPDNNGIKAWRFYRKAFAVKGVRKAFDVVGVHPYGPTLKRLRTQMGWVREEMRRAGFGGRDIWVTEIAWSSAEPPTTLGVGPEGQARMLRKAFGLFRRNQDRWNILGVHWYAWQDLPRGVTICDWCGEVGLVTSQRELKPAYHAFSAVAK